MDALYAASVHSFFNNEDSSPTYRCCPHTIMRVCIFILILYMKLQQLAVVATHAALSPELYWKFKLPPATSMPKSIADLLHPHETVSNSSVVVSLDTSGFRYHGIRNFETKLYGNPGIALFFLENDLKSGHKMKFLFTQSSNQASLLPRRVAKSIPFSSTKMAEILNKFDVKPGSKKAEDMKTTVKECEDESGIIKGEEKYCATSLESMLDFTILMLGENVDVLSTEVMNEAKKQEYTIRHAAQKMRETTVVVCHYLNYVYAVFYCHKLEKTVAYSVLLEGADGNKVKAVSVCHRDTSEWNPKHLAFQMLKVKPGSVPICHFLFQHSIAWVPKQN